jgi:hypothetical protein
MNIFLKIILVVAIVLVVIVFAGWVGLQIKPRPFEPYSQSQPPLDSVPLPEGLPAPVERFYRAVYGDRIPVIESAVITGTAELRPFGPVTMPSRFRFIHQAGQSYRHYIESTIFGIPVMKVNERYLDGVSRVQIPLIGGSENNPQVNQAANLGLWSESAWFPALFLTDPRVRWESVDDQTALLIVPFEDSEESYVVRFDPQTGLIQSLEAMRYKNAGDQTKVLWFNQAVHWAEIDGQLTMQAGAAIWMDDGKPWAVFTVEDIVFNVDVTEYLRTPGP